MLRNIFSYTEFYADHFICQVQLIKIIPWRIRDCRQNLLFRPDSGEIWPDSGQNVISGTQPRIIEKTQVERLDIHDVQWIIMISNDLKRVHQIEKAVEAA